ncbi:MAG TPA: TolC family protein [Candidatus Cloacimonetes bacterium]|nr:TolC family protein [Candidatus Cloacimonadota bacterium]HEX37265.1 TolC family protein [Candidatus Cloacimonadota bacterium]
MRINFKKRKIIFVSITLLLFSTHLYAMSLDNAISIALKNNKSFNAQKYTYQQSKWNEKNALTNFFPKVDFNATAVRIDNDTYEAANEIMQLPVYDPSGIPNGNYVPISAGMLSGGVYKTTYTTNLTVQQPIFNGGKVILGYKIARLNSGAALQNLESKQNDLEYEVAGIYFNILRFQDMITIAEKSLASSKAQLKKITEKFDVGMAKKSDVLQWQVKVENDHITVEELKNGLNILKTSWFNLLGLEKLSQASMPDKIDLSMYDLEIKNIEQINEVTKYDTLTHILSLVKTQNPDIKSLEFTEKIAKTAHTLAITNFLPSLNLQFTRTFDQDNKLNLDGARSWNLAAVFSLPIFHSGTNYTNLKRSSYEYKSTKLQLEDVRQKLLMAAENSLYELITKAKRVVSSRLAYKNAQENYSIVNDLFDQGMITNVELMDAEVMLYGSELNVQTSYYDYILAKYALNKYTNK